MRILTLLLAAFCAHGQIRIPGPGGVTASGGGGTFSLVSHTAAGSPNQNTVTTSAISTVGANLIVVGLVSSLSSDSISDSQGNTWMPLNQYGVNYGQPYVQLFYAYPAVTSATHTFTTTVSGGLPVLLVEAFSGAPAGPFDQQAGTTNNSSSGSPNYVSGGSITPGGSGYLFVTLVGGTENGSTTTVNTVSSPFTLSDYVSYDGTGYTHFAGAMAYWIQNTGTATANPTWTASGTYMYLTASMASFH